MARGEQAKRTFFSRGGMVLWAGRQYHDGRGECPLPSYERAYPRHDARAGDPPPEWNQDVVEKYD